MKKKVARIHNHLLQSQIIIHLHKNQVKQRKTKKETSAKNKRFMMFSTKENSQRTESLALLKST